jgi:hypothetical protein
MEPRNTLSFFFSLSASMQDSKNTLTSERNWLLLIHSWSSFARSRADRLVCFPSVPLNHRYHRSIAPPFFPLISEPFSRFRDCPSPLLDCLRRRFSVERRKSSGNRGKTIPSRRYFIVECGRVSSSRDIDGNAGEKFSRHFHSSDSECGLLVAEGKINQEVGTAAPTLLKPWELFHGRIITTADESQFHCGNEDDVLFSWLRTPVTLGQR